MGSMEIRILGWLLIINAVAFVTYGVDKYKAKHDMWRIPESTLISLAVAGGGLGALAGMFFWHHKTRKAKFQIAVPACIIMWVVLGGFLMFG